MGYLRSAAAKGFIFIMLVMISSYRSVEPLEWVLLEEGLEYLEVESRRRSEIGDSRISILRVDPHHFNLRLLSAKENGTSPKTISEWGSEEGLVAAVNAGMFLWDGQTNRDFMKNYDIVNNPVMTTDNAVVAFNPVDDSVPPFQIIDLRCEDWETLKGKYNTLIQGIRMVDCTSTNRWSDQPKKWSMVIIAEDTDGNALFIFTRSPYKVHDFVNILLELPLNITNAMYLEGGPEASFFLDHPELEVMKMGSFETGFNENDENNSFWDIPNIIGVVDSRGPR